MVPVVALGVGTWLGLGRPDARTALAAGLHGIDSFAQRAQQQPNLAPTTAPTPPLEREPPPVDASSLPDPPSQWPRLNADCNTERAWLLAEGPAHASGDGRRLVTFTFDDGPYPETAPTLLRILRQHRIRAAFFFIGKYLDGNSRRAGASREMARRIAAEGHFVGNHTYDHKALTTVSHAAAVAEIDDSAAAIERAVGKRPTLFRPPYGDMDWWLEGALRERRADLQLWSIDVEDMKRNDPDEIVAALRQQIENAHGGVVLLHDMHWPSVKAFNRLLRWIEGGRWDPAHPDKPGWDIVDLAEYLRATAAAPQPFANREELENARRAAAERRLSNR